jgi:hypothetical protein
MHEHEPSQSQLEAAERQSEEAALLRDLANADDTAPGGAAMASQGRAVASELEMEAEYLRGRRPAGE